jgi:hypothetical protein
MGTGYIVLPVIILIFYIIPFGLFFNKRLKKGIRIALLCIPLFLTVISIIYLIIDNNKTEELYRKFPQVDKIIFLNKTSDVRDSILQLQKIMEKLPRRWDHETVSYSLDKYRYRYNLFSFNWFDFNKLEYLEQSNNLHDFKIIEANKSEWRKYVSTNLFPFGNLTQFETKRFIILIKFLDKNSLSGAELKENKITFDYNDSLRYSDNTGSRTIALDTSGSYGPLIFDMIDKKDGFYLLRRKSNW